jgi:hypothetical protein
VISSGTFGICTFRVLVRGLVGSGATASIMGRSPGSVTSPTAPYQDIIVYSGLGGKSTKTYSSGLFELLTGSCTAIPVSGLSLTSLRDLANIQGACWVPQVLVACPYVLFLMSGLILFTGSFVFTFAEGDLHGCHLPVVVLEHDVLLWGPPLSVC